MHYQNLAQIVQVGSWLLGLAILSGCVSTPPTDSLSSLPCPVSSTSAQLSVSQNQAMMTQTLQKRLQEKERTIAAQSQQIEVLSSQLEALKQIDQETNRQPRKRLTFPIP
jgi:outer membrane murein-binding lipoprotein Lpp